MKGTVTLAESQLSFKEIYLHEYFHIFRIFSEFHWLKLP